MACLACLALASLAGTPALAEDSSVSVLRRIIDRHATDRGALRRRHELPGAPEGRDRLRQFHREALRDLEKVAFESLDRSGQVDYHLFQSWLRSELREIDQEEKRFAEIAPLVPFWEGIVKLEQSRRRIEPQSGEKAAAALVELAAQIERRQKELEAQAGSGKDAAGLPGKPAARRAAGVVDDLRETLRSWHDFYAGYDPGFTWWTGQPYRTASKRLEEYASFVRKKLAGYTDGEDEPIIGDPIGREALLEALESEMIPYTPEELIQIAEENFAWCDAEYRRAARDMGLGDDWRQALERVKGKHVQPGEQPKLIKELADEATRFVEERDLVTVPALCKEAWRMEMMSPERQKVNPYFTGGEVISVSFPTDTMAYEDRLMSLRGNNIHFCRATVHHELIPGHHLQAFMASRYRTHRRLFRSPFLVEGWALYWELLLWDLGFPKTPEDRVGMLFWRSHRCARIVFSLNFHLGKMTAQQAVDYLVDRVGHERRNAEAEVRRSVAGDYGPLYQAAYLLGGLQLRALRAELVESGKMKDREFHDAVLQENAIPIAMIRASLAGVPLARDSAPAWRFNESKAKAGERAKADARSEGARSEAVRTEGERTERKDAAARRGPGSGERLVFRDRVEPHWLAGGSRFWYRVDLPAGRKEFVLVDAEKGARAPAFDHGRLAAALSQAAGGEPVEADRLPIDNLDYAADGLLRFDARGRAWSCNLASYELVEAKDKPPAEPRAGDAARSAEERRRGRGRFRPGAAAKSPDERWEAFVRGHNLHLRELESKAEHALTTDGTPEHTYARNAERERGIEMEYGAADPDPGAPEVYWSADSKWVVAMRTRPGAQRRVYLIESSPRDQLQPKLHSYPYLKPGDEVPVRKPRLFSVDAKQEVPVDDALFHTPWSIGDLRWSRDSSRFTFLYNQRGHQALRIVSVEARGGQVKAIVDETSPTFIDYAGKHFSEYLDDSGEIIWMSERDGWNHLYLYDSSTGQVKRQITKGEWVVRGVDRVDREKRQIWFRAGGIRPGQDPYQVHYCRVGFDGTGLVVLTEGDGNHSVELSPDRRFLIDTWSQVDQPPVIELRRSDDGSLLCVLERADASRLFEIGWRPPERFAAKGRDGAMDIYGVIFRPREFDARRKYPVIESIYAGPQGAFVPKSFRASYRQQELADQGYIVVQIDGMGTSNRSKRFHDVAWKNLGDSGFPDRIAWMKAAAAKYPSFDLTRVGIYGGSAGGQNALRGLLAHGDFYKAGVADCGCHDNRMDKIWWNELWMSWPVGPHYDEQSNVTQAHKLQGKLLLIVGELDRNVDPASTMQVVGALVRADKDFDLLVVPGGGHGSGSGPYGWRRTKDFFARHLLGIEPRPAPPPPELTGGAASAAPPQAERGAQGAAERTIERRPLDRPVEARRRRL